MLNDPGKKAKILDLIDQVIEYTADQPDSPLRNIALDQLAQLCGKTSEYVEELIFSSNIESDDAMVERLLMPEARRTQLSDERIKKIVWNLVRCTYSEAEEDYWIEVLSLSTGLNIDDYIYFPDTVGLEISASEEEIAFAILKDRKY